MAIHLYRIYPRDPTDPGMTMLAAVKRLNDESITHVVPHMYLTDDRMVCEGTPDQHDGGYYVELAPSEFSEINRMLREAVSPRGNNPLGHGDNVTQCLPDSHNPEFAPKEAP